LDCSSLLIQDEFEFEFRAYGRLSANLKKQFPIAEVAYDPSLLELPFPGKSHLDLGGNP